MPAFPSGPNALTSGSACSVLRLGERSARINDHCGRHLPGLPFSPADPGSPGGPGNPFGPPCPPLTRGIEPTTWETIRSILRDEATKEIIKLVFAILLAALLLRLGLKEH